MGLTLLHFTLLHEKSFPQGLLAPQLGPQNEHTRGRVELQSHPGVKSSRTHSLHGTAHQAQPRALTPAPPQIHGYERTWYFEPL